MANRGVYSLIAIQMALARGRKQFLSLVTCRRHLQLFEVGSAARWMIASTSGEIFASTR